MMPPKGPLRGFMGISEASEVGMEVYGDNINIKQETVEICRVLSIDPMKLISSGVMVMTISEDKKDLLIDAFNKEDIELTEVGRITDKGRVIIKNGERLELLPPDADELYKVMS